MNTIQRNYEEWWQAVQPTGASLVQTQEMRRAFFAGAAAMLGIMNRIGGEDVSEAAGVMILENLHQESCDFFAAVGTPEEQELANGTK